jgi:membrane-associated phospholipid phosphatase
VTSVTSATSAAQAPCWRWREREWAWIALVCSGLCLLFSLWPELDLHISQWFQNASGAFPGRQHPVVQAVYVAVPWAGRLLALLALLMAVLPAWRCAGRWRRRILALGLSLLVGVGLVVNVVFKEQWGRARPAAVLLPDAKATFTPALRPAEHCRRNCSFVSGHAATGFALMSIGLMGSPRARRQWLRAGWLAGLVIGLGRIAQGGHFASDVLFAGLIVWACHAGLREAWLRRALQRRRRRTPMPCAP